MKNRLMIGLLCFLLFGAAGCAGIKQTTRAFLGTSTKELRQAREQAIVRVVNHDYQGCYKRVEAGLLGLGSHIYSKEEDLIAVYISSEDTTPAGVFFRQVEDKKTELGITSPSKDTKEYLAEKIFALLEDL